MERLAELERRYRGKPQELRLRVLKLFKEDPSRTAEEVSSMIGYSERSVRRWWGKYMKEGLDALLETGIGEEPVRKGLDPNDLELLKEMLQRKNFRDLEEVRSWFRREYDMRYSRSEVQYIIRGRLGIIPHWEKHAICRQGISFPIPLFTNPHPFLQHQLINFLNDLPLTEDTNEWNRCFRSALLRLLSDVDHIALNINQTCNLVNPGSYRPTMVLRQHTTTGTKRRKEVVLTTQQEEGRPSERVLEEFRHQGRPLENYHQPVAFDYYYDGRAYLGSLFLFRELEKSPISDVTIDIVDALEPFIIYAFANHVMWYLQSKPAEQIFQEGFRRLTSEADLSAQEQRVVLYHLLGYSYDEMAELLTISVKTVKKHINTIHHKTGARRQRELFARYFSPRITFFPEADGK